MSGLISFGLMLGVSIVALGSNHWAGLAGTFLVYGGSAQLTAITLLAKGLALPAAVATAAVVNLRLLLYSAALGPRFREHPRLFRWLAPHLIIDQTYLMATTRPSLRGADFRCYWRWLGGTVLLVWTSSVALGIAAAPLLPKLPHLGLMATALFVGMLVPRLTSRPAVVAAAVGGLVAAGASLIIPSLGIIAGALAGATAALAVSRRV
jgi:predicted branched-subunit amino acid permease